MFSFRELLLVSNFIVLALALTLKPENCVELLFEVSATATNKNLTGIDLASGLGITSTPDLDALQDFFHNAADIGVSGTETLGGTYCAPTTKNKNNGKIQLLFASLTVGRGAWSALGGIGTDYMPYKPEKYSWVRYANAKGYATLSMDRLGVGQSSRPEPFIVAQAPYE